MGYIFFKSEKDAERKALDRRLAEGKRRQAIKPAEESCLIEEIQLQEKLKQLADFEFIDFEMKPQFGGAFSQLVDFSSELPDDFELVDDEAQQEANLREDFEMLAREGELERLEPELVRFEEGEDENLLDTWGILKWEQSKLRRAQEEFA